MNRILATLALGTTLALTSLTPTAVSAQSLQLDLGGQNPQLRVIDPDDRRDRRGNDRYERRDRDRRGCSAGEALDKADRLGIRRARIAREGRQTISVEGRQRGDWVRVTFARDRRCSIID